MKQTSSADLIVSAATTAAISENGPAIVRIQVVMLATARKLSLRSTFSMPAHRPEYVTDLAAGQMTR